MSLTAIPFKLRKCALILLVVTFPILLIAQDSCPPPINPTLVYDQYVFPQLFYLTWDVPSPTCPIDGYEIEYASSAFEPGTGTAEDSLFVTGPNVGFSFLSPPLVVYIRTICGPPCGSTQDPDNASSWVQADLLIVPPDPPDADDGTGECADAAGPYEINTCINLDYLFWESVAQEQFFPTNPCTGENEFMIWKEFITPPLGEVTISATPYDLSEFVDVYYESFGMIIYAQDCQGPLLFCDTNITELDTLNLSLPQGESLIIGAWFNNADYNPFTQNYSGLGLELSICEVGNDCPYPSDISYSSYWDITHQSIEFEWDENQGSNWLLEYGPLGFTPGTGTEVSIDTGSPYLLEGLEPDTEYDFYLQTVCPTLGSTSLNIGPTNFTTDHAIEIEEPIDDGEAFCCGELSIPESTEVEAYCDSVYFSHVDSIVGDSCPYTVYRTLTVHDTCGYSIETTFQYDIVDNGIPCGCDSEFAIPDNEVGDAVALYGDWAVLEKGLDEIYRFEDGEWVLYQSIQLGDNDKQTLDLFDDVIVSRNKVYRLIDGEWTLETVLDNTADSSAYKVVAIHDSTIALAIPEMNQIKIYDYSGGEWNQTEILNDSIISMDMDENTLICGRSDSEVIGHIYKRSNDIWNLDQELNPFGDYSEAYNQEEGHDVAIDGNYAAVGFKGGGHLFTYYFDGEDWTQEDLLINPYREGFQHAFFSFGSSVDIDGDLMVVGDYRNKAFSGSIVVFERGGGSWAPQREIWPVNSTYHQRFGACLSLHDSKLVVGTDLETYVINSWYPYNGQGKYWFYDCLESNPTYDISVENDLVVGCLADVPTAESTYTLGNAWPEDATVTIESDTTGIGCDMFITREITVSDLLGNTSSATQQITVMDDEAPQVEDAPNDIFLSCFEEFSTDEPEFIDNCADTLQIVFSSDTTINGCSTVIEQTWTAIDACGNSTDISRTISIEIEPPFAAIIPGDVSLDCNEEDIHDDEPVFIDFCGDSLEITFELDTVGTDCSLIVQSWTAVNQCGGSTTVSRTITVENEPPVVVSAPEDLNITCDENWELEAPEFTDDCTAELDVTFSSDTLSSSCPVIIEHQWIAVDSCGNSTLVTRSITISDDTPPELSCPNDFSISLPSGEDSYTLVNLLDSVTATDNCSALEINQSTPPGTPLEPGNYNISVSASDGCNTAECTVEITVTIDTGMQDEDEPDVSLFPNPSPGKVTLQLPNSRFSRVELFDMTGKSLLSNTFNTRQVELDLKHLPTGIYAVQVITDEYRVVRKVVLE